MIKEDINEVFIVQWMKIIQVNMEEMITILVTQWTLEDKDKDKDMATVDNQCQYIDSMLVKYLQVDLDQYPTHCLHLTVHGINSLLLYVPRVQLLHDQ